MRPELLFELFADIESLSGVGPKNRGFFEKVAGARVRDLVFLAPTGLIDRRLRPSVRDAPDGSVATVRAEIGAHYPPANPPRRGRAGPPYRIDARDASADFQLVFFRGQAEYLQRLAPPGAARIISGKVERFDGVIQIAHPDHVLDPEEDEPLRDREPVYPLTAGLSAKVLRRAVADAASRAPAPPEWIDAALAAREGWPGWTEAIAALHAPQTMSDLEPMAPARRRLAYDEILAHQLALRLARRDATKGKGRSTQGTGALAAALRAAVGFTLTGAQERALREIAEDMAAGEKMMRLLQGDVGAGKTLVALLAMAPALEIGGQAALMAPTEILARQHGQSLGPLLDAVGVRWTVLTGRDKGRARTEALEAIASGAAQVVIGTHALFQPEVVFADLRLAVIDEQHRFGVGQRLALAEKGGGADVLLMTATPIPRTLALAQYGDMEVSILDEKPPGRKPIETRLVSVERFEDVAAGLARAIDGGARVYWVCPLVEESELIDLAAAEERARVLGAVLGPERVALVHGRMSGPEKEAAMAGFVSGAARVLVATTVIEVGVNVPEATIMVIERAERFGLSQLHQLRGRVGRGSAASHCLLLYGEPLSEAARARLSIMRESEDGFRLAEEDLKLRGAGDLLGVKQSGAPDFQIADLDAHGDLMKIAQADAHLALQRDPAFESPRGEALRLLLHLHERDEASAFLKAG